MASQRRSASPTRVAKPVKKKAARPVKSATKARPRPAGAAAARHPRPAKPTRKTTVPKKKAVTVLKKKATSAKQKVAPPTKKKTASAAGKPAVAASKKTAARKAAAPAAKAPPRRLKAVPRPASPGPPARPLGVLPADARARGIERPAHPAATAQRPVAGPVRNARPGAKAPGLQRVTEKDLKELEGKLLAERGRLMKEMGHLENTVLKVNPRDSAGDLSGYSFHMADAGTDAYEREKAFQFASTEGRLLLDLDEALRRLYRGEYGNCESCGNAIAKARLEAMPTARLCRDCKEKEERENRPQQ
jgi:DnaK suppressor protein